MKIMNVFRIIVLLAMGIAVSADAAQRRTRGKVAAVQPKAQVGKKQVPRTIQATVSSKEEVAVPPIVKAGPAQFVKTMQQKLNEVVNVAAQEITEKIIEKSNLLRQIELQRNANGALLLIGGLDVQIKKIEQELPGKAKEAGVIVDEIEKEASFFTYIKNKVIAGHGSTVLEKYLASAIIAKLEVAKNDKKNLNIVNQLIDEIRKQKIITGDMWSTERQAVWAAVTSMITLASLMYLGSSGVTEGEVEDPKKLDELIRKQEELSAQALIKDLSQSGQETQQPSLVNKFFSWIKSPSRVIDEGLPSESPVEKTSKSSWFGNLFKSSVAKEERAYLEAIQAERKAQENLKQTEQEALKAKEEISKLWKKRQAEEKGESWLSWMKRGLLRQEKGVEPSDTETAFIAAKIEAAKFPELIEKQKKEVEKTKGLLENIKKPAILEKNPVQWQSGQQPAGQMQNKSGGVDVRSYLQEQLAKKKEEEQQSKEK